MEKEKNYSEIIRASYKGAFVYRGFSIAIFVSALAILLFFVQFNFYCIFYIFAIITSFFDIIRQNKRISKYKKELIRYFGSAKNFKERQDIDEQILGYAQLYGIDHLYKMIPNQSMRLYSLIDIKKTPFHLAIIDFENAKLLLNDIQNYLIKNKIPPC